MVTRVWREDLITGMEWGLYHVVITIKLVSEYILHTGVVDGDSASGETGCADEHHSPSVIFF